MKYLVLWAFGVLVFLLVLMYSIIASLSEDLEQARESLTVLSVERESLKNEIQRRDENAQKLSVRIEKLERSYKKSPQWASELVPADVVNSLLKK